MKNLIFIAIMMLLVLLIVGIDEYVSKKEYCQKYAYTNKLFSPDMYKIVGSFATINVTQEVNCKFFGYYENYTRNYPTHDFKN